MLADVDEDGIVARNGDLETFADQQVDVQARDVAWDPTPVRGSGCGQAAFGDAGGQLVRGQGLAGGGVEDFDEAGRAVVLDAAEVGTVSGSRWREARAMGRRAQPR